MISKKLSFSARTNFLWISFGLLLLMVLLFLFLPIYRIGFSTVPINYNEGWNAYHTARVTSGELIYNSNREWTPVNYPPVYFYIISILQFAGSHVLTGRYISLVSLFVIAGAVAWIVNKLAQRSDHAFFSGLFCLSLFTAFAQDYVGMNDPQLLGHVFVILGFITYLKRSETKYCLLWAAILTAVGLFTKHNLISLPLAITIDLCLQSRRDFIKWLAYLGATLSCFTLVASSIAGNGFLSQVMLTGSRIYSVRQLLESIDGLLIKLFVPLILVLPFIIHAATNSRLRIVFVYFVISLFTGIYFSGGAGTNINIHFDTFISLSILVGLLLSYSHLKYRFAKFLPLVLALGVLVAARIIIIENIYNIANVDLNRQEQLNRADAAFLAQQPRSVLCLNNIFICYASGKPFEYDPFNGEQMIATGKLDESKFLERIKSGYFSTILVDDSYKISQHNRSTNPVSTSAPEQSRGFSSFRGRIIHNIADKLEKQLAVPTAMQFQAVSQFKADVMQTIDQHYQATHQSPNGTFYVYKQ